MVDRSGTWSKAQRTLATVLAPIVIAAACIGGVVAAGRLPDLTERFTTSESVVTRNGGASSNTSSLAPTHRERSVEGSTALWQWSGASPGLVRTVYLTIDPLVYPVDGIQWYLNGVLDRHDIDGPLDIEFGLWHSSTLELTAGDIVSACWVGRDLVERCTRIIVR